MFGGKSCRKYQNTRFVFSNFFPENHVAYDNLGGEGGMTIWGESGRDRQATDDNVIQRILLAS